VKTITVVDLLRMLSGWDGDSYIGFDPVFGPWPQSYARKLNAVPPVSCQLAAQFMMGMPLQSKPGTHFSYANINFCLLGLIVNKLGGTVYGYQGYESYVREHLLAPMGITDMRIGSTEANEAFPNEVHYYSTSAEPNPQLPYGHEDILHKAYAVGGWVASAIDLVKFANGVGKLFNKTSLYYMEEMPPGLHYKMVHGYYPTHYAMGWFLTRRYNGYTWVTHGSFTGTRSVIVKRPDGYIIAVIFNKEPWPQGAALSQITYVLSQAKF
ncbi:MAG: beta-lactamase family protein, partial [Gammaproteobacteria bacterium]|nr:beta-lactamase family protein [Gammaproteobacteria bacterium]